MRHSPVARLARREDIPQVVDLLRLARADSPLGPQLCSPDSETLGEQLAAWCGMPGTHLLVADHGDDVIVGVALTQHVGVNLFSDVAFLQLEALYVDSAHRRHGVGRMLMALAAQVAAEGDASHVVTMPLTGSRSEQRFLSGLGFQPAATRRIAETAVLQRRLEILATPRRARGIDELIARRRRSRGLPPTPARGLALGGSSRRSPSTAGH
ncbi:GNAT family N-acetyltransferase [Pseudactinotalea sp.]|uniref:GNAT family N-acetyltransferase n=1 Tax=Pseudactinotalea sp. TaxID=1926260 RepID=UPI003B3AFA70